MTCNLSPRLGRMPTEANTMSTKTYSVPAEAGDATDRTLLHRLKSGEGDAASALYMRYVEHLRALAARQSSPALAARIEPDDIVQSVFRTFFRRAARDQYDIPEGEDLWKLLLVIALHKIRNAAAFHTAAKRDVRQTVAGGAGGLADWAGSTPDETGLAALRIVIDEALADAPESSKEIVRLRIEGHEVADIAAAAGRSKRSVERVLQQFRDHLKGLLDEDD